MDLEKEAWDRYPESYDQETGAHLDDWGYSECQRGAFIAGAKFVLSLLKKEV